MAAINEMRSEPRLEMMPPGVAMLQAIVEENDMMRMDDAGHVVVDVRNISKGGALIETGKDVLDDDGLFSLSFYDKDQDDWNIYPCKVVWQSEHGPDMFLCGMQFINGEVMSN